MLYIYSQIRTNDLNTPVVLDTDDTDVVVLAAHAAHRIDDTLGLKRIAGINDCHQLRREDVSDIIIHSYVHSECDTTFAFYGHGKKSVLSREGYI